MDFDLHLLVARQTILTTKLRMELTLEEIKKKSPHRLDYINPMQNTIERLLEAHFVFDTLEKEYRISRQRNSDLEHKLLILTHEYHKIKNENKELKEMLLND